MADPRAFPPDDGTQPVFAVWLELPLGTRLEGQGIIVLLSRLIAAAVKRGDVRIVIGCASWTKEPLLEVLEGYGIATASIEIVTGRRGMPPLVRGGWRWMMGFRRKRIVWPAWLRGAAANAQRMGPHLAAWVVTRSAPTLALIGPLAVALAVVGGATAGAVAIAGRGVRMLHRAWVAGTGAVGDRIRRHSNRFAEMTYPHVHTREHRRAARAARRAHVPAWLAISPATKMAHLLGPNVVFAIADLVMLDTPLRFTRAGLGPSMRRVSSDLQAGAESARFTVSYSSFVRDQHVVRALGIPERNAHVIAHAPPDLSGRSYAMNDLARDERLLAAYLASEPARASWSTTVTNGMAAHLPLARLPYLLVSSQLRPHKNTMHTLRAFAHLVKGHGIACKLILTGDLHADPEARAFILEHGLAFDVLSLPNVPAEAHVALIRRAALSLVPTLFEGGFPFGFAEALAVGTPVMMSRIPVTTAVLPPEMAQVMTFDPFDPIDMAARWRWGLAHREDLLALQRPLFRRLTERTWDDALMEYVALLARAGDGCG